MIKLNCKCFKKKGEDRGGEDRGGFLEILIKNKRIFLVSKKRCVIQKRELERRKLL